ncbi:MAG: ABC transporter permease [Actinomycetes bacterium]|nr:MAG: ABC transporter [Actinomycetota bacterium]
MRLPRISLPGRGRRGVPDAVVAGASGATGVGTAPAVSDLPGVRPTALSWRDLTSEAVAGLASRPARTLLTVLGTVLGISALVATVGIAQTAGNRIVGSFSELEATSVVVTNETGFWGGNTRTAFPRDVEDRIGRLNGVTAVGVLGTVPMGENYASAVQLDDPSGLNTFQIDVYAASPGLLDAVKGEIRMGRWFDSGHETRADDVVVLGPAAAQRLGVYRVDQQPVIFLGEKPFVVMGILRDVARQPQLLDAIIMPEATARKHFDYQSASTVQIDVALGAAQLIGKQAPIALNPDDPTVYRVRIPPSADSLRNRVEGDVNSLFLILGGVSLLVGAIGIANVTLVSVLERVGEIGLRRAVGARRRHIATQFLVESTAMGLVGGIIGATLGILVIVVISATREWTPVLSPLIPVAAPLLGAATGLLAGIYPSLRAASLEPVDALRAGT